jgi:hypothetical protein
MDARVKEVIEREKSDSQTARQLPAYRSHKTVWALKIAEVLDPTEPQNETDGTRIIVPVDDGYAPFRVSRDYVRKHNPQAGGYWVQYADGYQSWSPAQAFDEGYTRV